MSTNKILLKFAKKGINLSPEAYEKVISAENPLNFASSLIVKLKGDKFSSKDLVCVSGKTIDEITGIESTSKSENPKKAIKKTEAEVGVKPEIKKEPKKVDKTPQPPKEEKKDTDDAEKFVNKEILEATETIKDTKVKFKRNEQKTNVQYDFKIIQDTSKKSYTSGEIENLISYFKSRYEKLSNILSKRPELRNYTKIADIDDSQDTLSLILMVKEIRSSKNGHKIVEFEDDTGNISVLFSNKNDELFAEAEKLVRDEVIG